MHAEGGEGFAEADGMDGAGREGPVVFGGSVFWRVIFGRVFFGWVFLCRVFSFRTGGIGIKIGDGDAVDGLGGMTGKPAEDVSFVAALGEDIPDGFDLARGARDGADAGGVRVGFDEAENAVLVGAHAGGDGVPQHGRENGVQGSEVAHDSVVDEMLEGGHEALVEEGGDNFPVGGVPTDEEDFFG